MDEEALGERALRTIKWSGRQRVVEESMSKNVFKTSNDKMGASMAERWGGVGSLELAISKKWHGATSLSGSISTSK